MLSTGDNDTMEVRFAIIDDNILEQDEVFNVSLMTTIPRIVAESTTVVTILNDDGMQL